MYRPTSTFVLVALGVAAIGLAGCKGQQPTSPKSAEPAPAQRSGWPRNVSDANMNWSSMAYPTGEARTSSLGIEKGVPRQVRLNQPFDYMLVVTNLTNLQLDDVVVTEQMASNFKMSSSSPQGQAGQGGVVTWALGDLKPNESKTIKISGTATSEQLVTSCTSATFSSALCAAIPVVSPKLMLTKSGPADALKCDEVTYTLEVSNTGSGSITGVKINDPLPNGMTTADGKKAAEYVIGTLEAGQKKTVTARVRSDKSGKYDNKATATADGGMSADSGVVSTVFHQPKLAITKKCPGKQFIGRTLDYEITVSNTGDGVSRDTVVEDPIPSGATFASASDGGRSSGGRVVWNLGNLEPKATKTVKLQLNAASAGTFSSTATARGVCADAVTAQCSSEVTGIPAILLEVIDIEDPSQVGTENTYVITVTNQGSAPGTNIKLVCTIEANQTYISSSGPTTGSASGASITFAPLATLAPKAKAEYRVKVKNVKVGDVRFKTTMTSDQLSRNVEETEATNVYE